MQYEPLNMKKSVLYFLEIVIVDLTHNRKLTSHSALRSFATEDRDWTDAP